MSAQANCLFVLNTGGEANVFDDGFSSACVFAWTRGWQRDFSRLGYLSADSTACQLKD